MKKFVLISLVLFATVILMSCTKSKEKKEKITIVGIYNESSSEYNAMKYAFDKAREEGYEIEYQSIPSSEYFTLVYTLAESGDSGDIFIGNGGMAKRLAEGGVAKKLDDIVDNKWRQKYDPNLLAEFTFDGSLYGIPSVLLQTHVIFYNKKLLKQLGYEKFPKKWDEFKKMLVKAQNAGMIPIALGNKDRWVVNDPVASPLIMRMIGKDWIDRFLKNQARYDEPLYTEGIKKFEELVKLKAFNKDANSLTNDMQRSLFYKGNSLMFIEGSWAIKHISKGAPEEIKKNLGFAVFPEIPGGKGSYELNPIGAGWTWMINSKLTGKKLEDVIAVFKHFSDDEYGKKLLSSGALSPISGVDPSKIEKIDPLFAKFLPFHFTLKPGRILVQLNPPAIYNLMKVEYQNIMTGTRTAEEFTKIVQKKYEELEASK